MGTSERSERKVALLIEHHFEADLELMRQRFAQAGVTLELVSYLWGLDSLKFNDLDFKTSVDVSVDIEHVDVRGYAAVLVPDGYAADRLRYQNEFSAVNRAPATRFLRAAIDAGIVVGISGFGIWLLTVAPDLLQGRSITTRPEAAADARNAGATIVQGLPHVWVDQKLVTSRGASATEPFMEQVLRQIAREGQA